MEERIPEDNLTDDPELCKRESDIKYTLKKIEEILDCNGLLALIYNPLSKGGEIIEGDSKHIKAFLEKLRIKQATLILDGPGGDFCEGLLIAEIFRSHFPSFKTIVPLTCGSALCLLVLKSDQLRLLKEGSIHQIDPWFEYDGSYHRAIKYLHNKKDPISQEKARNIFLFAEEKIFDLIRKKPSLFKHKEVEFNSIDRENIIEAMLNRDEHSDSVKKIAFQFIPFNVQYDNNKELNELCKNLVAKVLDYLILTGRRYCLACTYVTTITCHKDKSMTGQLLFSP